MSLTPAKMVTRTKERPPTSQRPAPPKPQPPVCKGCGNSGVNTFSKDGFCVCQLGREMKEQNDAKVDRYFDSLNKNKENRKIF